MCKRKKTTYFEENFKLLQLQNLDIDMGVGLREFKFNRDY